MGIGEGVSNVQVGDSVVGRCRTQVGVECVQYMSLIVTYYVAIVAL